VDTNRKTQGQRNPDGARQQGCLKGTTLPPDQDRQGQETTVTEYGVKTIQNQMCMDSYTLAERPTLPAARMTACQIL